MKCLVSNPIDETIFNLCLLILSCFFIFFYFYFCKIIFFSFFFKITVISISIWHFRWELNIIKNNNNKNLNKIEEIYYQDKSICFCYFIYFWKSLAWKFIVIKRKRNRESSNFMLHKTVWKYIYIYFLCVL